MPILVVMAVAGCAADRSADGPPLAIATVQATMVPRPDLDSLANSLAIRADTLSITQLPDLEREIREWLGRLQFEDPALAPRGQEASRALRPFRGRLLDALGWSYFRRGDLIQAEAALVSAVAEINSRGTTTGYARHFYHLGRVYVARGRWGPAVEAFVDAEVRGMGATATPELEIAYRRLRGSLRGLDAVRGAELARVEDERRQQLVTGALSEPLPSFRYPLRMGSPFDNSELAGGPAVVALWDATCAGCADYDAKLDALATALRRRNGRLVGVWLGKDPGSGPTPARYPIVLPPDPEEARRLFSVDDLPALLVVDAGGRIRYRWTGREAMPPPSDDILVQVDHVIRRFPPSRPGATGPGIQ